MLLCSILMILIAMMFLLEGFYTNSAGSMYILGIWRISDPWNLSGSRADSEIKDVVYEEENTGRIYYGWNIRRH